MPEGVDAQPSIHPPEPLKPVVDSATPDAGQWWAVLLEEKHLPLYQQLLSSANAPIHPPPENLSLQSFSGWMDSVLSDMARGRQKRKENRETLELAEQINPGNAAALLYAYTEARCAYYEAEVAGDTNRIFLHSVKWLVLRAR